jgi:hypothetical protein
MPDEVAVARRRGVASAARQPWGIDLIIRRGYLSVPGWELGMLIGRDRAAWAMPSCAACGPSPVREPGQFSGLGRPPRRRRTGQHRRWQSVLTIAEIRVSGWIRL